MKLQNKIMCISVYNLSYFSEIELGGLSIIINYNTIMNM